jgi:hypothetical protein
MREFERGLVAVSSETGAARLSISGRASRRILDVFEGKHLKPGTSGNCEVELAPASGRVHLFG